MPMIRRQINVAGSGYMSPFVGPAEHPVQISVNIANLTTFEVDSNGYIVSGTPLNAAGALVTTGAVYGVIPESVRVANSNAAADLTAAGTVDVAVIVLGLINRHIAEANLGRAYTAAELTGFATAPCGVKLAQ